MADIVERLIFDDSQAIPTLKNVTENVQKTSKEMQNLLDIMSKDAVKASAEMAKSEGKVNEAIIKTSISMKDAKKQLGEKIKGYSIFGVSIDGIVNKLKGFYDNLILVKAGLKESAKETDTQKKGVDLLSNTFGGGGKIMTTFIRGLNLLRIALISTGLGALVVVLGSLIAYLTQTSEGTDKISRAMSGVRAVVRVLLDTFAELGETIFNAFSEPKKAITDLFDFIKDNIVNRGKAIIDFFGAIGTVIKTSFTRDVEEGRQAVKDLGTALVQFTTGLDKTQQDKVAKFGENLVDKLKEANEAGKKLFDSTEALYERETQLILKVASLRRQVADLRFVSKDENESYTARIKAAEKALVLERELINSEVETAKARLAVIREENRLKGEGAGKEDRRTETQAVAAVQDAVSNASKLLRELNKTHQNLIQEAKKEFTNAVENLVEIRDRLITNAKEFNLVSDSQEQTYELQKQLDILNEQRKSIIAINTFFQVATGQSPFTKELELTDKLIERVTATIQRGGELKPIDPIAPTSSTRLKELQNEIIKLQKLSVDLNVDTTDAQKKIQEEIDKLLKAPVKSTETIKLDLPPIELSTFEGKSPTIYDLVEDFLADVDSAEDLLRKTLDSLFGDENGEAARKFIGGLYETFQAYSAIFQESSQLQIEKNNEIIKQKEEQVQKLEDELDYELDLQKEGLANNVGTKQEELNQLLAEQERYEKENEEIKRKSQRNQLILDTVQQSQSLITSSINIIKGFSNIPIIGLPLGIAAVASLLTFFAATKAKAFAATKLEKGARRIDDHIGFVDRFGDSDKGAGQGYKLINARTGNDTNVRISGKEMLLPEGPSLIHADFLMKVARGDYNNVPLKEIAEHYEYMGSADSQSIINNVISNVVNNNVKEVGRKPKEEKTIPKQWVPFEKDGKQGFILLEIPENKAAGSKIWMN